MYMKIMLNAIPDNTGTNTNNPFNGERNTMEAMTNTAIKAQRVETFCPSIILSENFMLITG